jgi:mRNA interferase MazF
LPCTTRLVGENILRVPLPKGIAGNRQECEIMIDQSRAIDNRRFVRALKALPRSILREVETKLRQVADL